HARARVERVEVAGCYIFKDDGTVGPRECGMSRRGRSYRSEAGDGAGRQERPQEATPPLAECEHEKSFLLVGPIWFPTVTQALPPRPGGGTITARPAGTSDAKREPRRAPSSVSWSRSELLPLAEE